VDAAPTTLSTAALCRTLDATGEFIGRETGNAQTLVGTIIGVRAKCAKEGGHLRLGRPCCSGEPPITLLSHQMKGTNRGLNVARSQG
jgi:hypothetical protein